MMQLANIYMVQLAKYSVQLANIYMVQLVNIYGSTGKIFGATGKHIWCNWQTYIWCNWQNIRCNWQIYMVQLASIWCNWQTYFSEDVRDFALLTYEGWLGDLQIPHFIYKITFQMVSYTCAIANITPSISRQLQK